MITCEKILLHVCFVHRDWRLSHCASVTLNSHLFLRRIQAGWNCTASPPRTSGLKHPSLPTHSRAWFKLQRCLHQSCVWLINQSDSRGRRWSHSLQCCTCLGRPYVLFCSDMSSFWALKLCRACSTDHSFFELEIGAALCWMELLVSKRRSTQEYQKCRSRRDGRRLLLHGRARRQRNESVEITQRLHIVFFKILFLTIQKSRLKVWGTVLLPESTIQIERKCSEQMYDLYSNCAVCCGYFAVCLRGLARFSLFRIWSN